MNGRARLFSDGSVRGGVWISESDVFHLQRACFALRLEEKMDLSTRTIRFVTLSLV